MLYLFSGTDLEKSRAKFHKLTLDLRAKRPEAGVFSFDAESFDEGAFGELLGAGVLFGSRALVLMNRVCENKEAAAIVLLNVERMADSDNVFFVLETELLAAERKKFEKYAKEVYEHTLKEKAEKKKGDSPLLYAFCDALGNRSARDAWTVFMQAGEEGIVPEQLFYKSTWQLKNMAIAHSTDPVASGLHSYVYGKAKRAAQNYDPGEIAAFHRNLVRLYHEARRGTHDFGIALERLVLDL